MGETEVTEYRNRLASRLSDFWVGRFDYLRPLLTYGPDYHRPVADNWRTAVRMAADGRADEAYYWLDQCYESIPETFEPVS